MSVFLQGMSDKWGWRHNDFLPVHTFRNVCCVFSEGHMPFVSDQVVLDMQTKHDQLWDTKSLSLVCLTCIHEEGGFKEGAVQHTFLEKKIALQFGAVTGELMHAIDWREEQLIGMTHISSPSHWHTRHCRRMMGHFN